MPTGEVACVIPARLASYRFPRKLLAPLGGETVLRQTLRRAQESGCFSQVICFADSDELIAEARKAGCQALLTPDAENGTARIAASMNALDCELIVNLQGDEPLMPTENLRRITAELVARPMCAHTLALSRQVDPDEAANPNRVKVVMDPSGRVLDFRRKTEHGSGAGRTIRPHLGVYAYSRLYLRGYAGLKPSLREREEKIEFLRDLKRCPMVGHEVSEAGHPVDTPEDLEIVTHRLPKSVYTRN